MKRVEWRPYREFSGGWELHVDYEYIGVVDVDGDAHSSLLSFDRRFGSQPLAAQALLRAAGVEL